GNYTVTVAVGDGARQRANASIPVEVHPATHSTAPSNPSGSGGSSTSGWWWAVLVAAAVAVIAGLLLWRRRRPPPGSPGQGSGATYDSGGGKSESAPTVESATARRAPSLI
ncbi:MAG: hypothetical protein L3K04_06005, partial [Thermoplasmata archaeon]|nr:hypothetical protein [Thermoplasmata archaeon]